MRRHGYVAMVTRDVGSVEINGKFYFYIITKTWTFCDIFIFQVCFWNIKYQRRLNFGHIMNVFLFAAGNLQCNP